MGEAQCGLMVVTQWKECDENDETASVRRMRCRVVTDASLRLVTGLRVTMLNPRRGRPHVYKVSTLFTVYRCRSSQCCTSTDLFLSLTVCHSSFEDQVREKWSSRSSHVADLVYLHTLVAEPGDTGHGAGSDRVEIESGRDAGCNLGTMLRQSALQARRGQSVAQPVARRVARRPGTRAAPRDAGMSERV